MSWFTNHNNFSVARRSDSWTYAQVREGTVIIGTLCVCVCVCWNVKGSLCLLTSVEVMSGKAIKRTPSHSVGSLCKRQQLITRPKWTSPSSWHTISGCRGTIATAIYTALLEDALNLRTALCIWKQAELIYILLIRPCTKAAKRRQAKWSTWWRFASRWRIHFCFSFPTLTEQHLDWRFFSPPSLCHTLCFIPFKPHPLVNIIINIHYYYDLLYYLMAVLFLHLLSVSVMQNKLPRKL